MELQPILHVWVHTDNDLVDLTITPAKKGTQGARADRSEVIHTNKKHPFLTVEKGFLPVGQIKLGMHVVEANGQTAIITGWKVVPGVKTMYNLEVAQDHTFTVGAGQWVVHNCGITGIADPANQVEGQPNLYKGEQVDVDALSAQGWKKTRDVFGYVSDNFKAFLKSQGQEVNGWEYRMQTWQKGKASIENHYWFNPYDPSFGPFHHH